MTGHVVAIDGPAGAGKSAVAREVAHRLGWRYVDTGAMYRAVALAVLEQGIDPADAAGVARVAEAIDIHLGESHVEVDGTDVTERIRDDDVTVVAPIVATHPGVRQVLLGRQRAMADDSNVVMEGRDIASTVAPEALVKIWLTASPRQRARRRVLQLGLDDHDAAIDALEASLTARDTSDSSRSASPLTKVSEAVVVDSTDRTLPEVIQEVLELVERAFGNER